ncbi:MAG: fatty acid desaturase [Maricaulaceae bacterium]
MIDDNTHDISEHISPERKSARMWLKKLAPYKSPNMARSVFELVITFVPFLALWGAAAYMSAVSYWLTIPICVLAGCFLVRLFLIQHDCSHGAFFKKRALNDWTGRFIGVLTMTPYDLWKRSHLIHHASHGNLDQRGIGDVMTLTVEEYNARSKWGRFTYRLYRNPFVLFGVGPIFIFMLHHRLPIGFMKSGAKYWVSTMGTNLAMAAIIISGIYAMGWLPFLVTYLCITFVGAVIGVWLFYVQHQFEDTMWDRNEDWQVHDAALYGSTHYDLPPVLRWMTANIGIHHVHHLYSRIPFYNLSKIVRDHPRLGEIRRLTLLDSFKTVRLKLWDAKERRMVSFKEARSRRVAA